MRQLVWDFTKPLSVQASDITGVGCIFSVRAANRYSCRHTNLKSTGMLIHWQPGIRGTYGFAAAALNGPCRIYTVLTRRALKKHTQVLFCIGIGSRVPLGRVVFVVCFVPVDAGLQPADFGSIFSFLLRTSIKFRLFKPCCFVKLNSWVTER